MLRPIYLYTVIKELYMQILLLTEVVTPVQSLLAAKDWGGSHAAYGFAR